MTTLYESIEISQYNEALALLDTPLHVEYSGIDLYALVETLEHNTIFEGDYHDITKKVYRIIREYGLEHELAA